MKNNTVIDLANPEEIDALTELLRSGAKTLIAFEDHITSDGRQRVVRSGYHPEREIVTGVGKVSVAVPFQP